VGQQSVSSKATAKTLSAQHYPAAQDFHCPDTKAKQACDSFAELLKAKDSDIPASGYACFRPEDDEFFVVEFTQPSFVWTIDPDTKKRTIPQGSKSIATGSMTSFRNGVTDSSVLPTFFFLGSWRPLWDNESVFASEQVNFQDAQAGELSTITITGSQLSVNDYPYTNRSDKKVEYNLTLQRSTGRFSENYKYVGDSVPFLEHSGRCVWFSNK
jgi:hypothetical protein